MQSSRLALPLNRRSGQREGAVGSASVGSMLFDGTHLATSVSEEQQTAVKRELGLRRAATFRERSPCPQKHIELHFSTARHDAVMTARRGCFACLCGRSRDKAAKEAAQTGSARAPLLLGEPEEAKARAAPPPPSQPLAASQQHGAHAPQPSLPPPSPPPSPPPPPLPPLPPPPPQRRKQSGWGLFASKRRPQPPPPKPPREEPPEAAQHAAPPSPPSPPEAEAPHPMSDWGVAELAGWARAELLDNGATAAQAVEVLALLREHEIDGEVMEHLGADDLQDLGIEPELAEELAASIVEAAPRDWRGPVLRDERGRRLSTIMRSQNDLPLRITPTARI